MSRELARTPATPTPAPPAAGAAARKKCAACDTLKPLKEFRPAAGDGEVKTCAACRERYAERRRERRDEERGELRSRALDLAQALLFLADLHPDYRPELDRMASRIQKRGRLRGDRGAEAVTLAIKVRGCHTLQDLAYETKMLPSDVSRVLAAMRACGLAEFTTIRRAGGECEWWTLVEAPAPSPVRP